MIYKIIEENRHCEFEELVNKAISEWYKLQWWVSTNSAGAFTTEYYQAMYKE